MGKIENTVKFGDKLLKQITLTCNVTDKKLINIIVKQERDDLINVVKVNSPFAMSSDSGEQEIKGLLSFSPITKEESPMYWTKVKDVISEERDDKMYTEVLIEGASRV